MGVHCPRCAGQQTPRTWATSGRGVRDAGTLAEEPSGTSRVTRSTLERMPFSDMSVITADNAGAESYRLRWPRHCLRSSGSLGQGQALHGWHGGVMGWRSLLWHARNAYGLLRGAGTAHPCPACAGHWHDGWGLPGGTGALGGGRNLGWETKIPHRTFRNRSSRWPRFLKPLQSA